MIKSGTGHVCGEIDIIDSEPLTKKDFYDYKTNHMLPLEFSYEDLLKIYKNPYRWTIAKIVKYDKPFDYEHPLGAVIWVKNIKIK